MKRPDKAIEELNGTLNRLVLDYIARLEGYRDGIEDAAAWMTRMARVKQPHTKSKAPTDPRLNCGRCRYSSQIDAPEGSDRQKVIVCTNKLAATFQIPSHEPYPILVAQFRAWGCGPKATLWEAKEG